MSQLETSSGDRDLQQERQTRQRGRGTLGGEAASSESSLILFAFRQSSLSSVFVIFKSMSFKGDTAPRLLNEWCCTVVSAAVDQRKKDRLSVCLSGPSVSELSQC